MIVVNKKMRFFKININDKYAQKIVFSTDDGYLEYTCMPIGYTNLPNIFVRAITKALAGLAGYEHEVYMDDIIILRNDLLQNQKSTNF